MLRVWRVAAQQMQVVQVLRGHPSLAMAHLGLPVGTLLKGNCFLKGCLRQLEALPFKGLKRRIKGKVCQEKREIRWSPIRLAPKCI